MIKRVLQIIPSLELGGTEAYVMNNYRYIDKEKIQFDFLVFNNKEYPYINEIKSLGGRVFFGIVPNLKNSFVFFRLLKNIINKNGPYTAIHCHANAGNAIPLLCAFLCGVKNRISHCHAICDNYGDFLSKAKLFIYKSIINLFATKQLACSDESGNSLYGKRLFSKKGMVCKNAIDVESFIEPNNESVAALREEFNMTSKYNTIVGNISRFDDNKNQSFILDVFNELLKKDSNMLLLLGGIDGGELQNVKNKANELNIEDNVLFIGARQDVPACLNLIDVYLFPSKSEGFGIALIEAQAAGCMCFASEGVPKQTDMRLGLCHYLPIDIGAKEWADKISEQLKCINKVSDNEIKAAFRDRNYDISESPKRLIKIYEKG